MGGLPGPLRPWQPGKRSRLIYLLRKYSQALEADFAAVYPQEDVGRLWRSRHWRKLLNLIDHLPQNTWYHQAISTDIDHAVMLLEAQEAAKKRGDEPPPAGPALRSWSPEVDMLARVLDATNQVAFVIGKANGAKGKAPKPAQRPPTAMETAKLRFRQKRHDILVRRMLPHQFQDDE